MCTYGCPHKTRLAEKFINLVYMCGYDAMRDVLRCRRGGMVADARSICMCAGGAMLLTIFFRAFVVRGFLVSVKRSYIQENTFYIANTFVFGID